MEKILMFIVILLVVVLLTAFFVQLGWSWFMVPVFGLKPLTFTQALGFAILAHSFGKATSGK